MGKSRLQQEFEKQVRLIKKQIKALQQKGIAFNPEEIEAITKKRTRLKKADIEKLKTYSDTLNIAIQNKPRTAKEDIKKGRQAKKPDYEKHPRKKLSEEELKAHRNFRARVRRLEQQGYDVSAIGKVSDYTLEQLQELKGRKLSELATKGGKTAYEIRKEKANEKRKETIAFRERVRQAYLTEPQQEIESIKPRELGDYIDVGRGALTDKYHDTSIIETLIRRFKELDNIYGRPIQGHKQYLINLFYDIINERDDESGEGLLAYEDYLRSHEIEIMEKCEQINHDSDDIRIENCFANLFEILNQGALDNSQKESLSDYQEYQEYDYT